MRNWLPRAVLGNGTHVGHEREPAVVEQLLQPLTTRVQAPGLAVTVGDGQELIPGDGEAGGVAVRVIDPAPGGAVDPVLLRREGDQGVEGVIAAVEGYTDQYAVTVARVGRGAGNQLELRQHAVGGAAGQQGAQLEQEAAPVLPGGCPCHFQFLVGLKLVLVGLKLAWARKRAVSNSNAILSLPPGKAFLVMGYILVISR